MLNKSQITPQNSALRSSATRSWHSRGPSLAAFLVAALVASAGLTGCQKPKSSTNSKPKASGKASAGGTTTSNNNNAAATAHYSDGGVTLPPNTPRGVLDALKSLTASPEATTRVLIKLGAPAAPAMAALAGSENLSEARSALTFFEKTRLPGGGAAAATLSASTVPSLRHQALITLAALKDSAHTAAIETALKNAPDGTTRSLAIRALSALKTENGTLTLVAQLDDADEQVTSEVAAALGGIGTLSAEVLATLQEKAASDKAPTAVGALTALRRNQEVAAKGAASKVPAVLIAKAMGHPDTKVVLAAVRLLPHLDDVAVRTANFDKVLGDKRTEVRRVAVEVLANANLKDGLARAKKLIADPAQEVAAQAVHSTAALTPATERRRLLLPLIAHALTAVRQAAVIGLSEETEPPLKPIAARLALERDTMTRTFIVAALGKFKHTPAAAELVAIVGNKKDASTVRIQAMKSLQAISGETIGMHAARWREWLKANPANGAKADSEDKPANPPTAKPDSPTKAPVVPELKPKAAPGKSDTHKKPSKP